MLKEGEISIGHARALGLVGTAGTGGKILAEGSPSGKRNRKKIKNPAKVINEKPRDYEFHRLETTLEEILGTRYR